MSVRILCGLYPKQLSLTQMGRAQGKAVLDDTSQCTDGTDTCAKFKLFYRTHEGITQDSPVICLIRMILI
jgi:hypothetical protein